MISFSSLFDFIRVIIPDPKLLFKIAVSVADAAAVNPNAIKTLSLK